MTPADGDHLESTSSPSSSGGSVASGASVESARDRFRADALRGLGLSPKSLAPKHFYNRVGSELFDAICELPEYYVTRAETAIMRRHVSAMVESWGPRVRVVEPGAGSGTKTRLVLEALGPERCVEYVPVDISREHLNHAASLLRADYTWLRVTPVAADFARELSVPPPRDDDGDAATVVYFPGSTIGNFEPPEAERLLARFRRAAGTRGAVVVGVNLKKNPATLHAAYNDAQGVTAAFNRNLLARMNRELGANFDVDAFAHYAFYEPIRGRVEMHLVSLQRQEATVSGRTFTFAEGESIHTECSYKYNLPGVTRVARAAGLDLVDSWLDDERRFAVLELRPLR